MKKTFCAAVLTLVTASLMAATPYVEVGPMTAERAYHTATRLSAGAVLVAGGFQYMCCPGETVVHRSAEVFDFFEPGFRRTGDMNVPRYLHTATLLPNGKVLIAGGTHHTDAPVVYERSSELYDPATGTFTLTGAMAEPRAGHTATLLRDGRVLIAGGYVTILRGDGFYDAVARSTIEIYDPTTGLFTQGPILFAPRAFHTSLLLPDGRVLSFGGTGFSDNRTGGVYELFDPQTLLSSPFLLPSQNSGGWNAGIVLPNGDVLAIFGVAQYLFHPESNTFTEIGRDRVEASLLVLLNSGLVFVVPRAGPAYLYDSSIREFRLEDRPPYGARAEMGPSQTATLLPTGNVLIAGGQITTATTTAESVLYIADHRPPAELHEGRFAIEVEGVFSGSTQFTGQAVQIQDESAYFYFIEPDNPEVIVKIVGPFNVAPRGPHYILLWSALTDAAVTVRVRERFSNQTRIYEKPAGEVRGAIIQRATAAECAHCLDLGSGALKFSATAKTPDGRIAEGYPIKISERAGFFAFPAFTGDFQNPEVVLKALRFSESGDFLFIYDGLTDLEYKIRQHTGDGTPEVFEKTGSAYRGDILPPPGLWVD